MRLRAGVAALALMGVATAAQGQPASDLAETVYHVSNNLGMLRGLQEEDSIVTLRFWATGKMTVGNQTYDLKDYAASIRWHGVTGMRTDITRLTADGKSERLVQVVGSGKYAWNETEPGVNPTPAPGAYAERQLLMYMLPPGLAKALRAAGANAKITTESGMKVVTLPAPGVAGTMLKATLNAKNMVEKVEARVGNSVIETSFAEYGDLNEADYKADIMFPRRIVQKKDGATVLDLTVTKTNTYNPYVIVPVPQGMEKAAAGE
ncbi:MAG: hypothetical protein AB7I50_05380 [Vicinamibacterales bacterium]